LISSDGGINTNKRIFTAAAVLACVVFLVLWLLTRADFLGDMVLTQMDNAVSKQLNAGVGVSSLEGNPIVGFKGADLELKRSGKSLLRVKKFEIRLSIPSLIKRSPRIGTLVVDGLSSDVDSLRSLMPERKEEGSGPKDIPIDKIEFLNTEISTKIGMLKLDKSYLELRGSEWFAPSIKGSIKGIPFTMEGICAKERGNWTMNGFICTLGGGRIKLSGPFLPSADINVEAGSVDLKTVAYLIPSVSKYGVSGTLSCKARIRRAAGDLSVGGSGVLKEAMVKGVPLHEVSAVWDYSKGHIEVEVAQGKVFDSSMSGRLRLDTKSGVKYLDLVMRAKNLRFADWADAIKSNGKDNAMSLRGGISSMSADLKGPLDGLVGSVVISPSTVGFRGLRLTDLRGLVSFNGSQAGTVDFSALYQGKKMILKGKCALFGKARNDLKFSAGGIPLENLSAVFPSLKQSGLKGSLAASMTIEGPASDLLLRGVLSSASVELKKIGAVKNITAMPEYRLKDRSLSLKRMSCVWNGALVTASGGSGAAKEGMSLGFGGTFKNVRADKLYPLIPFLEKMTVEAVASGQWELSGTTKAPKATVQMRASHGRFRALEVDKFSAKMTYSANTLTFSPMYVFAAEGTGVLKCVVNLPKKLPDGRGRTRTTWDLTAKIKDADLSVLNGLLRMDEDIGGACTGDVRVFNDGSGMRWSADIAGGKPRWKTFCADGVHGLITGSGGDIKSDGLFVSFLKGDNVVRGRVALAHRGESAKDARLAISVSSNKINIYELLRKYLPFLRGVQGFIKADIDVTGTLGVPKIKGSGTLSPFRYRGFLLPVVDVDFNGGLQEVSIPRASAKLNGGAVVGSGRLYLKDKEWNAELRVEGRNVALRQFGAYLPGMLRSGLGGKADFDVSGSGKINAFSGSGSFSSDSMRFLGVRFTDVKAPFFVSEGYAVMEDVKAKTNGGTVSGGAAMDIKNSLWGGHITAIGVDVEPLLKQAFPKLKGSVRGKGEIRMRMGGEVGRRSTVKGGGLMLLRGGDVSGFDAVEAVRKFTNNKPLRFDTVQITATYDGGNITVLPGTQAVAPAGDPVYRNVMLDGLITKDRKISMFAMGKVNIRALNVFLGALQGIIDTGMDFSEGFDKSELLQNFLGGILSGFAKNDFRFVTMNIKGDLSSLSFSNVKVDKTIQKGGGRDMIPISASDPDEKFLDKDTKFRLTFEIPIGPGSVKTPSSMEGQFIEQTLENLLKHINFGS